MIGLTKKRFFVNLGNPNRGPKFRTVAAVYKNITAKKVLRVHRHLGVHNGLEQEKVAHGYTEQQVDGEPGMDIGNFRRCYFRSGI